MGRHLVHDLEPIALALIDLGVGVALASHAGGVAGIAVVPGFLEIGLCLTEGGSCARRDRGFVEPDEQRLQTREKVRIGGSGERAQHEAEQKEEKEGWAESCHMIVTIMPYVRNDARLSSRPAPAGAP